MSRPWLFLVIGLSLGTGCPASAGFLLETDLSTLNNGTRRPTNGPPGIGQGVKVDTTYVLDHFDMRLSVGGSGHIKFMIWDADNVNLLYSGERTIVTGSTAVWVSSPTLDFTIDAGKTYFFGVIADTRTTIFAPDWLIPSYTTTQNGLTLLKSTSSNYSNYASPVYAGDGSVTFPLRIVGDKPADSGGTVASPEPSSILSASLAIGVAAIVWRRRGRRNTPQLPIAS